MSECKMKKGNKENSFYPKQRLLDYSRRNKYLIKNGIIPTKFRRFVFIKSNSNGFTIVKKRFILQ